MTFPALPVRPRPLLLAALALLLLWLPALLLGPDGYVLIDDNLDAELNIPYLLHRFGVALDYRPEATVPAIMNGLPRTALRPGLSVTVALFGPLDPLPAYWLNQLLVRLAALAGMYLLLRRYAWAGAGGQGWAAAVALAWAALPTYTMYGLSALGTPWPLLAVLNLRTARARWTDWLVLTGFPLWSSLVLAGAFIVAGLGLGLLADGLRTRRLHRAAWAGVGLLALSYAVVEWPLLRAVLIAPEFVPHRVEFLPGDLTPGGLLAGLRSSAQFFFWGQYHASRFFRGAILLTLVLAAAQLWRAGGRARVGERLLGAGALLLGLLALALTCGFYAQLVPLLQRASPALGAFNLSRFHFLTPLLWFGVLVLALRALPSARLRALLLGLQLLIGLVGNPEWLLNLRLALGRPAAHEPTWRQFVAPKLFERIRLDLEQRSGPAASWRVACLGFPPAVAQLNNFYTLDSYQNNYPLPYKHRFRPIIAGELAKSPELRRYFDSWGNRCYLFSAELGRNFRVGRTPAATVQDFRFGAAAFRRLGGRYVLSAAQLARPEATGLRLLGQYDEPTAYWRVYLYSVD
ncbi:DUF6044 family protein [Hymenobacter sp. B81]|uniref:DUF6044 family protein n=1 Tax=Hymenobacter sp. B81 TaxID=3344878 RepID=UPI0037DC5360